MGLPKGQLRNARAPLVGRLTFQPEDVLSASVNGSKIAAVQCKDLLRLNPLLREVLPHPPGLAPH